ncbi:MAG: hypothetical protein ACTS73_04490 [Arsenophonus sp. NEOnobi-MAG3]
MKVIQDKQGLCLNGQIDIPELDFMHIGKILLFGKEEILFFSPFNEPF